MARECIAVYIMASKRNGTLYIGVTSNLIQRIYQHRTGMLKGFTKEHDVKSLAYYELHDSMEHAIHREKRLKKYTRQKKLELIESVNPNWMDLWDTIAA